MATPLSASQLNQIASQSGFSGGSFSSVGLNAPPPPNIYLSSTPHSANGTVGPTTNQTYSGNTLVSSSTTPINSSVLGSTSSVNLSSIGGSTGSGGLSSSGGTLMGGNQGLSGAMAPMGYTYDAKTGIYTYKAPETPNQPQQDNNSLDNLFKQYLGEQQAPPDLTSTYQQLEQQAGIQQKQQEVQRLTNQLNTITATAQANALSTTGQGRGIPEAIIGGQQAQIYKEAAIQALPIQAQLSAATGDLQLAQTHLDTMFSLVSKDIQAKYEYKGKVIDAIYNFATKQEQNKLDAIKTTQAQTFQTQQNNLNYAQTLATSAFNNGQSSVGSAIMKLMQDPTSPTFTQDVANYAKQLQPVSQGVSAGTEGGVVTLSGKPQTTVQAAANGYADRLNQSNITIDQLGSKFAGSLSYGNYLPNALQSGDRQAYEQAKRNFVTAVLRRESGAAISPSEFDTEAKKYFPQAGDKADTVILKSAARNTAINNVYREANVPRPVLPGMIIESGGIKYRVSSDGVTLEKL